MTSFELDSLCNDPISTCEYGKVGDKEREMNWKVGIDICTLMCKQIAGGNLLYSIGSSAWCSVMT